jgi:hypothetical protein
MGGDAKDAVDEAKRLNRQLAARCLVRVQDAEQAIKTLGDSEARQTELIAAKYDYDAAMKELRELDRLAGQAMVADANAAVSPSDGGEDYVQRALDNVRDHAASLDAQVKLADELAPAQPAPAAPPEDPEEAARKQFEALRANKPKKTL